MLLTWILILLILSGFFTASEISFRTSNKFLFGLDTEKKTLATRIIKTFYAHPDDFLVAMRAGNILVLIIYVLLSVKYLMPFFSGIIENTALLILSIGVIAFIFILLIGEFIPQLLVRIDPNRIFSICAIPLYIAYIILYPIIKFVTFLSQLFLRLFGVKIIQSDTKWLGREDLDDFIQKTMDESPEDTELERDMQLFQKTMEFSTLKTRDCMIPRTEIIAVDKDTTLEKLTNLFVKSGYSKIVVYEEDIDHIIGYIHSSELFVQYQDWTQSILPLPFVPENMPANKLMKTMLDEKKSMAVIVDEFGGTSGIITLEDLVEEIFGEIEDEHDTAQLICKKIGENEYILSGRTEIDAVNESFNLDLTESDEYQTIAGLILSHCQTIPKVNEWVKIENYTFKIIKVTQSKIELVRLKVDLN